MATIVLTAAGSALGPLGAALGGALGNALDRELFKPKGREGPRLTELRVQTSSYGTQIPRLFGAMRVAGSVIWATDLVEHRSSGGGGKGRPSSTSYSYSASFAVALSARPILGVGRIWADGKLLRGAGGDFKSATGFRLHLGHEDQAVDPLIASAEGIGQAPAHRGTAYAVFEEMALADFGNRIPSLSFEVFADAGSCDAGAVAAELAGGLLESPAPTLALRGFAAQGTSIRAAVEMLAGAAGGWFRADGERLALIAGDGAAEAIVPDDARAGRRAGGAGRSIAAADTAPKSMTLSHYDPARDYQAGVQRAVRPGAGTRAARMELPVVLEAGEAKAVAEASLARLDLERERRTVTLPWRAMAIRPGERVTIAGVAGSWRVERWLLEAMVVELECVPVAAATLPASASGGRVLAAPDVAIGETLVHAFELPPLGDAAANALRIGIAAAGTEPGWRSAALLLGMGEEGGWTELGAAAMPAVMGRIVTPPGAGVAALEDRAGGLTVALANAAMALGDADAAQLAAGANLAMAGDELLQFGRAEPLGAGRWRLSRLWRGRRGTEPAIGSQVAGDRFVLLDGAALVTRELPLAALGGSARVLAQGAGDGDAAAEAVMSLRGVSVLPPAPVHLRFEQDGEGNAVLHWIRRSRAGWVWIDGADAPLGEETEAYRVEIARGDGAARAVEVASPQFVVPAAERSAPLTISVRQIGTHGRSPAAVIVLPPLEEDQ
jgi:hypothetical protein